MAVGKRFVFAVLARALTREHLRATLLRRRLWRIIAIITESRTAVITTRTAPIVAALATRLPLPTRTTPVVTTFTTRTAVITTRTAPIVADLATRLPLPTGTSPVVTGLTTRLPLTTRPTPVLTSIITTRPTPLTTAIITTLTTRLPLTPPVMLNLRTLLQ
ncbi:MAG: hypothetical protein ACKODN_02005 [Actinomycetota bacterium]